MTILPVVERELRVASRRWTTYWSRSLVALSGVGLATYGLITISLIGANLGIPAGKFIFWGLSGMALLSAALCGISYTADTISKERREGTLGLLFLTDLRGVDVALGKLVSSSIGAMYGLLAFQPIMAMALLLGGITGGEYARMSLVLVATLVVSLCLGMAASTYCESNRSAPGLTFVLLVFFGGGFPMAGATLDWFVHHRHPAIISSAWFDKLSVYSPVTGFVESGDVDFGVTPIKFWTSLGYSLVVAVMALSWASFRLPRVWQDKALRHRRAGWFSWTRRSTRKAWAVLLDHHPIVWLTERHLIRRLIPWGILMIVGGGFGLFAWRSHESRDGSDASQDFAFWFFATGVMHTAYKFWMSAEAGRQLLDDKRSGGLELQLATSLSDGQIVRGHLQACWRLIRYPLLVVILWDIFLFNPWNPFLTRDVEFPMVWARELLLLADLATLGIVSLDGSLVSRTGRMSQGVVARVLLLPWATVAVLLLLAAVLNQVQRLPEPEGTTMVWFWAAACLANDFFWARLAYRRLRSEFRVHATQPLDAQATWWIVRLFQKGPKAE
ncbi:MAG TPA: ABC transporter permease subunit [Candidatus Limnocylindria bacterium]|nr:ABC transporter permease subunit [Candidatus Limnocylindria bacterium]